MSIDDGGTIKYDSLVTSVGGGYSTTTGVFTVPIDGVYVFHFHAVAHANQVHVNLRCMTYKKSVRHHCSSKAGYSFIMHCPILWFS